MSDNTELYQMAIAIGEIFKLLLLIEILSIFQLLRNLNSLSFIFTYNRCVLRIKLVLILI